MHRTASLRGWPGRGRRVLSPSALVLGILGWWTCGCSNYADMLQRGQGYYEDNDYEQALAVFRQLDLDQGALGQDERTRFYYLRGMTDYRLGYTSHARYWLGLCKVSLGTAHATLKEDELKRLDDTLEDLNRPVFGLAAPEEKAPESAAPLLSCGQNSDCGVGLLCLDHVCRPTAQAVEVELSKGPTADLPAAGSPAPVADDAAPRTDLVAPEAPVNRKSAAPESAAPESSTPPSP